MQNPATSPASSSKPRRRRAGNEPFVNYTKVPNTYDVLISEGKLGGATQRDIIWILIRATWGAEKRSEWASLSLTQLAERCGGIERTNISNELKDMTERGLLEAQEVKGCGSKRYRLTPENWRAAAPYKKKDDPRIDTSTDKAKPDTLVIRPGAKGRCVPARLAPAGREPIDFQIAYANTGSAPVEVSSFVEADIVRITFGDHKANRCFGPKTEQKANTVAISRLTEFANSVQTLLWTQFEKAFDPAVPADKKFLNQIMSGVGDDLTAAEFDEFCRSEIRTMVRRRKDVFPGILIPLATQAAKRHVLRNAVREEMPTAALPRPVEPLDASKPWDQVRNYLKGMLSEANYENWFARTRQITFGSSSIVVGVPDQGTRDYIEETFADVVKGACHLAQQPEKIIWRVEE